MGKAAPRGRQFTAAGNRPADFTSKELTIICETFSRLGLNHWGEPFGDQNVEKNVNNAPTNCCTLEQVKGFKDLEAK